MTRGSERLIRPNLGLSPRKRAPRGLVFRSVSGVHLLFAIRGVNQRDWAFRESKNDPCSGVSSVCKHKNTGYPIIRLLMWGYNVV